MTIHKSARYAILALIGALAAAGAAAAQGGPFSVTTSPAWPGGPVIAAVRWNGPGPINGLDLSLSMPDSDLAGYSGTMAPFDFPIHYELSGSGPAALRTWPRSFYSGSDDGGFLVWNFGSSPSNGANATRDRSLDAAPGEVVVYVVLRVGQQVAAGASFPLKLTYHTYASDSSLLDQGEASGSLQVGAPPAAPTGPPTLRIGSYRAPPGRRFRAYVQAQAPLAGHLVLISRPVPPGLLLADRSIYNTRTWPLAAAGGGAIEQEFQFLEVPAVFVDGPDHRFGGGEVLEAAFQSPDPGGTLLPAAPGSMVLRYYLQVPDDAPPGASYPLHLEAYSVPPAFDVLNPMPVADGLATSDPSVSLLLGDLNGDGRVTIADALIALRIAVGLQQPSQDRLDQLLQTGDLAPLDDCQDPNVHCVFIPIHGRGDGRIDLADAVKVLRAALALPIDAPAVSP